MTNPLIWNIIKFYTGTVLPKIRRKKERKKYDKNRQNFAAREKAEKLLGKLKEEIYTVVGQLEAEAFVTKEPVGFEERTSGRRIFFKGKESYGELFDCAWFRFWGVVPENAWGEKTFALIDVSGEGLVVDREGNALRGITTKSSTFDFSLGRPTKLEVPICDSIVKGGHIEFWVDVGCNDLFGRLFDNGRLMRRDIAFENTRVKNLYYDCETLLSLSDGLLADGKIQKSNEILYKVLEALNTKNGTALQSIKNEKNDENAPTVAAVGHAHLDLAWLWPIRETFRKGARTFATQLRLIEQYDNYIFGASQGQLFLWLKEKYPELYQEVKERVKDGRIEVQGAMWVEADSNLSGGEALIRQMLYGKQFFMEEFGLDMKICWLPDSFGYSGALPQILKGAGVPFFMTQKMSWNTVNEFPHHTFKWKGIDGSEVLAHMLPENTYNAPMLPSRNIKAVRNNKQKAIHNEHLALFGIGDGGAGPGIEHLERMKRQENLAGAPKVVPQKAIDFFKNLAAKFAQYPTYEGELYLEKHQGTYTTQSLTKKNNRKIELALRECEYALAMAEIMADGIYDKDMLVPIWHEALLYQFHDILPGSSIKRVYDECNARYEILLAALNEITDKAYKAVVNKTEAINGERVFFNSLGRDRRHYFRGRDDWFFVDVPKNSFVFERDCKQWEKEDAEGVSNSPFAGNGRLENDVIEVIFDKKSGAIESIYDKVSKHEFVENDKLCNQFKLYWDFGDGWDIKPTNYYERRFKKAKLLGIDYDEDGPFASATMTYIIGKSKIVQTVTLEQGSPDIKFETKVTFNETRKMLRVAFPVTVFSERVKYNIPFGYVERPTTHKNKIDKAKYETSGQKWVDINDGTRGVTLINDCKYGFHNWDNTLDMNLIRSPMRPGVDADKGEHEFTYVFHPYTGGFDKSDAFHLGYLHNTEIYITEKAGEDYAEKAAECLCDISNPDIIFENIKKSEVDDNYVLRFYNSTNKTAKTDVKFGYGLQAAGFCDLLDNITEKANNETSFSLTFKPFEIISLSVAVLHQ
jgi:alpha-mannosidase